MKFGKVLKVSSENMPAEMHDLFLRYKELKKQIKLIPVSKDAAAGNEKQASVSPDGSATGTGSGSAGASITATVLSPEEHAFVTTLNEDLARFNRYFIEKEEEAVIRLQALCDELAAVALAAGLHLPAALMDAAGGSGAELEELPAAGARAAREPAAQQGETRKRAREEGSPVGESPGGESPAPGDGGQPLAGPSSRPAEARGDTTGTPCAGSEQPQSQQPQPQHQQHHHHHHHHTGGSQLAALQAVKSRLVQFHGEMVLLLHWSLLNYAAVVKILKKHDKRTGVLLRAPYLANVLQQPFSSTTIMSRLAKRAEELVVATTQLSPAGASRPGDAAGPSQVPAQPGAQSAAAEGSTQARPAQGPPGTQRELEEGTPSGAAAGRSAPGGGGDGVSGGRTAASASEISSMTFAAADREVAYGDATGQPLVGSTMHALETWAALRKNAITPSTVLAAEVDQQPQQVAGKRKADAALMDPAAAAAPAEAVAHEAKAPRNTEPQ